MRRSTLPTLLFPLAGLALTAQEKVHIQPQVHKTVALPAAAHKKGQTAGFFVDPLTGNRVYRLSDSNLCPNGATHFYTYTNQFSPQGRIVFECQLGGGSPHMYPLYDADFRMLYDDALDAARVPGAAQNFRDVQWSLEREVLFAVNGNFLVEMDPFGRKTRVLVNLIDRIRAVEGPGGKRINVSTMKDLSVGPGDRLMVHLQCQVADRGCPGNRAMVGVAVYDPRTGKANALYVPVPGDKAPFGFDEAQWSQNPKGRLILVYGDAPNYSYSADLSSRVQLDDNHGHRGYFCGSNGRCYLVRSKSDTLPNGKVGEVGCKNADGTVATPWRAEEALYDDETGRRVLIWGCDLPGQNPFTHYARALGGKDVFGISTERLTFGPSLRTFAPTDEAIVRGVVEYEGGMPARVRVEPVAYHRSADGARSQLMGRACGYWALPRVTMDHTGTRFLFDSTMSHPEWPVTQGHRIKTDCRVDVYVAVYAPKP